MVKSFLFYFAVFIFLCDAFSITIQCYETLEFGSFGNTNSKKQLIIVRVFRVNSVNWTDLVWILFYYNHTYNIWKIIIHLHKLRIKLKSNQKPLFYISRRFHTYKFHFIKKNFKTFNCLLLQQQRVDQIIHVLNFQFPSVTYKKQKVFKNLTKLWKNLKLYFKEAPEKII